MNQNALLALAASAASQSVRAVLGSQSPTLRATQKHWLRPT